MGMRMWWRSMRVGEHSGSGSRTRLVEGRQRRREKRDMRRIRDQGMVDAERFTRNTGGGWGMGGGARRP